MAQRQWLFVYDGCGVELNCLKAFRHVITMRFLPQHLLLATAVRGRCGARWGLWGGYGGLWVPLGSGPECGAAVPWGGPPEGEGGFSGAPLAPQRPIETHRVP